MTFISIILPIYNTEAYLPKCINSILAQTLSSFELLLINDGSTDNSGRICDQYAQTDKRIQVVHQQNKGVSYARNKALSLAKGRYIYFIDSDDWIEPSTLEVLYLLLIEKRADLSTCGYTIEDEKGNCLYNMNETHIYHENKWEAIYSLFHDKHYKYKGNLCDKLYKKDIIDKNHLRFNEKIYYNEDRLFIFQYFIHCHYVAYTTIPYYHYITRDSSAMNTFENIYNEKTSTFMDAFDIMVSLSKEFPKPIRQVIAIDYVRSAERFFIKNMKHISFSFLKNKLYNIAKSNYTNLTLSQKIGCTIRYIKIFLHKILTRHEKKI